MQKSDMSADAFREWLAECQTATRHPRDVILDAMREICRGAYESQDRSQLPTVARLAEQTGLTIASARYHITAMRRDGVVQVGGPRKQYLWPTA